MNFTFSGTNIATSYDELEVTFELALEIRFGCTAAVSIHELANPGDHSDDLAVNIELQQDKPARFSGMQLIQRERLRQFAEEGFTTEQDLGYIYAELPMAAYCYLENATIAILDPDAPELGGVSEDWPFDLNWWKPSKDPVRNLVKAGALIAAEIDRLQLLKQTDDSESTD